MMPFTGEKYSFEEFHHRFTHYSPRIPHPTYAGSGGWMERRSLPGKPFPLGATWDGTGVNFALYSENATKVELCLFDSRARRETERIILAEQTAFVWHGY